MQEIVEGSESSTSYMRDLKKDFTEFLTKEEVYSLLELLLKTKKCFGKFDLFNKWRSCSIKINDKHIAKQMKSRLGYVSLKPFTYCSKCEFVEKCSLIRISLIELQTIWDDIYFSKGSIFTIKEEL